MKVEFSLGTKRAVGELVRENKETVVVRFYSDKKREWIEIKRHKDKHYVKFF